MRIALCTAIWKRPEVFRMFGHLTHRMAFDAAPFADVKVFCVGSEGQQSRRMAEKFGFEYLEYPNQPLGQKWNAVIKLASAWQPDYYLLMGSDDAMDAKLLKAYLPYMENGHDYIGVLDWHFYDIDSGKALYWKGYRNNWRSGITCGAGRMLSARLVKAVNHEPWLRDRLHNMLDSSMEERLRNIQHTRVAFMSAATGGMGLDIKGGETQMTKFAQWDNSWFIDPEEVFKHFDKKILCAGSVARTVPNG